MKPRALVGLLVFVGLVIALNVTDQPAWIIGGAVAAALLLVVPLSIKRYRLERKLARTVWGAMRDR
jgi:hypothetical protein